MSFIYVLINYENCVQAMKNIAFFINEELAIKYLEKYINKKNQDRDTDDPFYHHKLDKNTYGNDYDQYTIRKYKVNPEI